MRGSPRSLAARLLVAALLSLATAAVSLALWPNGPTGASVDTTTRFGAVGAVGSGGRNLPVDKVAPELLEALDGGAATTEVIVSLRPGARPSADLDLLKERTAASARRVLADVPSDEFELVQEYEVVPALLGKVTKAGVTALEAHPNVVHVGPNGRVEADLRESVPLINANDAHSLGVTGQGVVVAVLDTGIDTDHLALRDSLLAQRCFLSGGGCPNGPTQLGGCPPSSGKTSSSFAGDGHGHGTHVSGIITKNGPLGVGVAPDAIILAMKVLNDCGSGSFSNIINAYDEILLNHPNVDIINMSLGDGSARSGGSCEEVIPALTTAINTARTNGIITFASAGNRGAKDGLNYPACIQAVNSVGSVYDADLGTATWARCTDSATAADLVVCSSQSDSSLDHLAPGCAIESAILNNGLGAWCGTSMASPSAAGVAALLMEYDPTLTPQQIEDRLKTTGKPITDVNRVTTCRVDALAAINNTPQCDVTSPTPTATPGAEPADLIVESIETDTLPGKPVDGQDIRLTVTVKNQGPGPAGSFFVDFYEDLPGPPDPFQIGDTACVIPGLAAGATTTCSRIISYALPGTYSMWAQVDTDEQVTESDDANNLLGPQKFHVNPRSDLIVQSIETDPTKPVQGEDVQVTVTVQNQGAGPAAVFYIDIYKHLPEPPSALHIGDVACFIPGLGTGATTTCSRTVSYSAPGSYDMWARVDVHSKVIEADELNNALGPQKIDVNPPPSPAPTGTPPKPKDVLLVFADDVSDAQSVQSLLLDSGQFTSVDLWNERAQGAPSLATLTEYRKVLTWSSDPYEDEVALGDRLKQYVDQGGRLVIATLAVDYFRPWGLGGGIRDPGYSPFEGGGDPISRPPEDLRGTLDLSASAPHCMFKGIREASWVRIFGSRNPPLASGAKLLARDTYGNNVVAVNQAGNVFGIVINPSYLRFASPGAKQLFVNMLGSPCKGDMDGDGCSYQQENGPNPQQGGGRNPLNFWDFFDTPNPNATPQRDGVIAVEDIVAVVDRFGTTGDPTIDPLSIPAETGYHTAYDRSMKGPNPWNTGPPNGAIDVEDITLVVAQFGHSCVGPP